jgi:hypothetical protein
MHAHSHRDSIETVVSGKSRALPPPTARLGCASVVVVSAREVVRHAYAERLCRRSEVYGVTSRRELVEVLENISKERTPLGGQDMIVLDARGPALGMGEAIAALRESGWTDIPFVVSHEATLFDALSDGPLLVIVADEGHVRRRRGGVVTK